MEFIRRFFIIILCYSFGSIIFIIIYSSNNEKTPKHQKTVRHGVNDEKPCEERSLKDDQVIQLRLNYIGLYENNSSFFNSVLNSPQYDVGYGNKIYSVLTALTMAILTDRKMFTYWPKIHEYIELSYDYPFIKFNDYKNEYYKYNSEFFDEYVYYKLIIFLREKNNHTLLNTNKVYSPEKQNAWKFNKAMHNITNTKLPMNYSILYYDQYDAYFFEICTNPKYYGKLYEKGLVKRDTIDNARLALKNKKKMSVEKIYETLFQIGFEVGNKLLNKHWLIKENIFKELPIYEEIFRKNYIIGIQIRTEFLNDTDIDIFFQCAQNIENNKMTKKVKWYLTTDNQDLFNKKAQNYRNKIINVKPEKPIVQIKNGRKDYYRTVLDMELLSRTDILIITGGSTFGFVASMKNGHLGYFINGRQSMKKCQMMSFRNPGTRDGFSVF